MIIKSFSEVVAATFSIFSAYLFSKCVIKTLIVHGRNSFAIEEELEEEVCVDITPKKTIKKTEELISPDKLGNYYQKERRY